MLRMTKVLYSVWDNLTDRLIILDGTGKECAAKMHMQYDSFKKIASKGDTPKWHVEKTPQHIADILLASRNTRK